MLDGNPAKNLLRFSCGSQHEVLSTSIQ